MSTIATMTTPMSHTEQKIRALLLKMDNANNQVTNHPLQACEALTQIIHHANQLTHEVPESTFPILKQIQEVASDNLVQTALSITTIDDIEDILPILDGRLNRINNILNLGFYLAQHEASVQIDGVQYTAAYCAQLASQLDPENIMTKKLQDCVQQHHDKDNIKL